jgi:hypothetical protein
MQYFLQKKGWAIFWAIFHKLILSGVDVMITIFGKNGFFSKTNVTIKFLQKVAEV